MSFYLMQEVMVFVPTPKNNYKEIWVLVHEFKISEAQNFSHNCFMSITMLLTLSNGSSFHKPSSMQT